MALRGAWATTVRAPRGIEHVLIPLLGHQPGRDSHGHELLEEELARVGHHHLHNLGPLARVLAALKRLVLEVGHRDEAARLAHVDAVGVGLIHEALLQERRSAVRDDAIALHLSEAQATVPRSPLHGLAGEQVYVSFDNGRLVVFDIETGFPLWDGAISYVKGSSELENLIDSDANPVVDAGYVYTTNYQGNLNIFDIAQKRSVWESEVSSFFSPVLLKGMMIVVESDSSIKSIFTKTLEDSWNSDEYLNRELSNPISFNGNIIVGDFEGYVHVIDPLNGKTLGRKKISKNPIKRLISRSKNFYVVDEEFNLFSLSI